ncbi:MOZ protein represents a chromatin-associated acetyltransferase [Seiridium cupressi]
MSTARLTFLYPHLFRSIRLGEPAVVQTAKTRCRKPVTQRRPCAATFTTSARSKEAVFERHGKAVEPIPVPPGAVKLPQPENPKAAEAETHQRKDAAAVEEITNEENPESLKEEEDIQSIRKATQGSGAVKEFSPTPQQKAAEEKMQSSGPMDAVLHMPPPGETAHPHIAKPPYVHHFDTYTLVKQLEGGGYSKEQAITIMKAVRGLLAQNLDIAQEGLVSKSDVDNETYLFNAACSELSSEVVNNQRQADEESRQKRTFLQHEVDILTQKLSQDLMTLRDDVKGMFNDRKMTVREEQRRMEGAIQQVNLDISVTLTSDAKSEIEGLRWVLIRRSVLGILFMAVMTLGTIRYATYVNHEKKREADEKAREAEHIRRNTGREDNAPAHEAAEILAAN